VDIQQNTQNVTHEGSQKSSGKIGHDLLKQDDLTTALTGKPLLQLGFN